MPAYRYQDQPSADPSARVKIRLPSPVSEVAEWVWADHLRDDLYRIQNVPFLTTEVGLHDVVLALNGRDGLEYVDLIERRTLVRFDFALDDPSVHSELTALVHEHGIAVENGGGELAANLPDRAAAPALRDFLEQHASWFEQVDFTGARAGRT